MISDEDKYRLLEIAQKYNVSKVYLFGSNLEPEREHNDIDLAVEGIPDSLFFKFYSELIFSLSKPVDLVDLKKKSLLNTMVKSEGILLYGYINFLALAQTKAIMIKIKSKISSFFLHNVSE